jgi:hypothetical protein
MMSLRPGSPAGRGARPQAPPSPRTGVPSGAVQGVRADGGRARAASRRVSVIWVPGGSATSSHGPPTSAVAAAGRISWWMYSVSLPAQPGAAQS